MSYTTLLGPGWGYVSWATVAAVQGRFDGLGRWPRRLPAVVLVEPWPGPRGDRRGEFVAAEIVAWALRGLANTALPDVLARLARVDLAELTAVLDVGGRRAAWTVLYPESA